MREYVANVQKKLIDLCQSNYQHLLHPDPLHYTLSQTFGREMRMKHIWGLFYPSVRKPQGKCVAIFRPPALSIPKQGCHLDYIWDGKSISEVKISQPYAE